MKRFDNAGDVARFLILAIGLPVLAGLMIQSTQADEGKTPKSDDAPIEIPSLKPLQLPSTEPNAKSTLPWPELPKVEITPGGNSDALLNRFRDALSDREVETTGDISDDVMRYLQQRGSVLKGSVLDDLPRAEESRLSDEAHKADESSRLSAPDADMTNQLLPLRDPSPEPTTHASGVIPGTMGWRQPIQPPPKSRSAQSNAAKFRLAESLLRTARLLEKTAGTDSSRLELTARMRFEATKVLAEHADTSSLFQPAAHSAEPTR